MKNSINYLAQQIYNRYFRQWKPYNWLLINSDRGVIGCSEDLKKSSSCAIMLGYAHYVNHFNHEKHSTKIYNPQLHGNHPDTYYFALLRNVDKEEEETKLVNLTRNWGAAYTNYDKMCSGNKNKPTDYNTCIILHTRNKNWKSR